MTMVDAGVGGARRVGLFQEWVVDELFDEELLDTLLITLVELFDTSGIFDLNQGVGPLLATL